MEPLRAQKQDVVGYKKTVTTTATLYRDGTLVVDAVTDCNNSFHGLRGRITVLALDQGGRAVAYAGGALHHPWWPARRFHLFVG